MHPEGNEHLHTILQGNLHRVDIWGNKLCPISVNSGDQQALSERWNQ